MWNLDRPDTTDVRGDLDTVFPDGAGNILVSDKHKDALEALYLQYVLANGRPNDAWKKALPAKVQRAILDAYGEVSDNGKLRSLRAALKLNVDECPYCGFGEIKDLDHHLQKAHFNCFSIFPLNLVPVCSKCNGHKPRKPKSDPNQQHLHAYLEDVSGHRFLAADVTLANGAVDVTFRIDQSAGMSDELHARLVQHLKDFRLNERYPAQVNIFLSEQKTGIAFAYKMGGKDCVCEYLERSAEAAEETFGANDWRAALFSALAECAPFCNGGFKKALGC